MRHVQVPQDPNEQRTVTAWLARLPRPATGVVGALLLALLGALDVATGPEVSFSIFYLVPVILVTWYADAPAGLVTALAAAVVWLAADRLEGTPYSAGWIMYWNSAVRLGFFAIIATLVARLHDTLAREQRAASTDRLTGIGNRRAFYAAAARELARAARHGRPMSVAYLDLDNFKAVNDDAGHAAGDRVLRAVAETIQTHLRLTDFVARLGGDEFAILLPETDPAAAPATMEKLRAHLRAEMRAGGWPITISVGVITWVRIEGSVDELVGAADRLMYDVKRTGKNGMRHVVVGGLVSPPGGES
jgi:diguanylate cyclase (GGDEF)-like protein